MSSPTSGGATGYLYDAEGQRWAKGSLNGLSCNFSSNGFAATSTYLLGPSGEQFTELNGSGGWVHTNVFAAGGLLATYDSLGTHFALADWLGTKRIQASATGGIDETCMSLPFGDSLTCMGPDATEHHFTGKEHDIESGDDYFMARYYGSTMGRMLSPDWSEAPVPVPYADLANPQSLNLYAYVGDNPLSFFDITGHHQECSDQTSTFEADAENHVTTVTVHANCHDVPDPLGSIGFNTTIPTQRPQSFTNLPTIAPSKTGCFVKGVVAGAATALVVGAVATVAAPVVGATAVTVGSGALAVAGAASLGWTASHDISNHNWAGVAYDAGSLVGGLATGIAGGPRVATAIDPNATPGWSPQSWSAQAYDRSKGSLGSWMGSGPTHASAGVSTGAGGWLSSLFGAGCH